MRTGYNNLKVTVYPSGSTAAYADPGGELLGATVNTMSTFFPGGLYDAVTVFIPRDLQRGMVILGGDRLVIRNGATIVWEGEITGIGYNVGGGAEQGITLDATGFWGALLGKQTIERRWCDDRISAAAWRVDTTASGAELARLDRKDRLRSTAKSESWTNLDDFDVTFEVPTGETVGRVAASYDFQEASNAYRMQVLDGAGDFLNITASATSTFDTDHPGTPSGNLIFRFEALANQTGADDGTEYAELSNLLVYRYKAADATVPEVYLDNIAKNCQAEVSDLNSDTSYIGDYTGGSPLALEPFITNGRESWASVLSRAAKYGDTGFNEWYVRLLHSEHAASVDGKPVVEVAQYPALTDYDYGVRLDDVNLRPPLNIVRDFDGIRNWIVVKYHDIDESRDKIVSPDDNSNLTDTTSSGIWGQRDLVINIGRASSTTAVNYGRTVLARLKDPRFYISGPITVQGFIRAKNGNPIPASEIVSGERVRIENFLEDLVGVSTAGLTFIITRTEYDDASETCRIYTGVPDDLSVMLAQLQIGFI